MSGAHPDSPRLRRVGTNALASLSSAATTTVRAVAFWVAVVLPLAYLPLLADGVGGGELVPFGVLLAANLVALAVGHDYAR
jgi:uncharacterized RDD family membrane protein YckC